VLARGIAVQFEQTSTEERRVFDRARTFGMFRTQGVPIQRRDVLFDEQNADPETGQLAKYRVSRLVVTFLNDQQELVAEHVVGG
jgi:hypothetical protein